MKKPPHLYEYLATVISVYDGDTIRVDIDLGFKTWIHNTTIRFLGIDAPEIRGEERPAGLVARDALREIFTAHQDEVMLRTEQDTTGKYGRWLAEVFVWHGETWQSVNQMLVDQGLAERREY